MIDLVCHLHEHLVRSEVWPSLKGINWGREFLEGLFTFQNLAKLNISCHHFTNAYQIEVKRIWRHNLDVLKKIAKHIIIQVSRDSLHVEWREFFELMETCSQSPARSKSHDLVATLNDPGGYSKAFLVNVKRFVTLISVYRDVPF